MCPDTENYFLLGRKNGFKKSFACSFLYSTLHHCRIFGKIFPKYGNIFAERERSLSAKWRNPVCCLFIRIVKTNYSQVVRLNLRFPVKISFIRPETYRKGKTKLSHFWPDQKSGTPLIRRSAFLWDKCAFKRILFRTTWNCKHSAFYQSFLTTLSTITK